MMSGWSVCSSCRGDFAAGSPPCDSSWDSSGCLRLSDFSCASRAFLSCEAAERACVDAMLVKEVIGIGLERFQVVL